LDVLGDNSDFYTLIEKVKQGNQDAYDEMYKRYSSSLHFLCSKFCYCKEDAEEVVQDSFVIAFKKIHEVQVEAFPAYLRKVAANLCYHKRKSHNRQQDLILLLDPRQQNRVERNDDFLPEESLQNKESQAEIVAIIELLPPRQREMVYLHYYAGLNATEMSAMLGCTERNVYKTLRTAKQSIKKMFAKRGKKIPYAADSTLETVVESVLARVVYADQQQPVEPEEPVAPYVEEHGN